MRAFINSIIAKWFYPKYCNKFMSYDVTRQVKINGEIKTIKYNVVPISQSALNIFLAERFILNHKNKTKRSDE
jgi:hypothetical protein